MSATSVEELSRRLFELEKRFQEFRAVVEEREKLRCKLWRERLYLVC